MKKIVAVLLVIFVVMAACSSAPEVDTSQDDEQSECGEKPSEDVICIDGEWVQLPSAPGEISS